MLLNQVRRLSALRNLIAYYDDEADSVAVGSISPARIVQRPLRPMANRSQATVSDLEHTAIQILCLRSIKAAIAEMQAN